MKNIRFQFLLFTAKYNQSHADRRHEKQVLHVGKLVVTNGLSHPYHLDAGPTSLLWASGVIFFFFFIFSMNVL